MRHSPMTRSRWRARAVSSRSWASTTDGQHEVVPAHGRLDPAREPLEARGVLGSRAARDVGDRHRPVLGGRRVAGGPRGPVDLLRGEAERDRGGGRVEARRRVPVERIDPQLVATVDGGNRRVHDERRLARPGRVPVAAADQDHGARLLRERPDRGRAALDQRLHRADHQAGAAQPRLARRRGGEQHRVVARRQAPEVERDRRPAEPGHRRPAERPPGRPRTLAHVDQRLPGGQPARDHVDLVDVHRDRRGEQRPRWPGRGCRRRAGGPSPGRARGAAGSASGRSTSSTSSRPPGDQRRERARAVRGAARRRWTRSRRREPSAPRTARARARRSPGGARRRRGGSRRAARTGGRGRARARPGAGRRRPASRPKALARPRRRTIAPGPLGLVRARLDRITQVRDRLVGLRGHQRADGPVEQPVHLLVGDVQAAEPVARVGVDGAPPVHRRADALLDQRQPAQEVRRDGSDGPSACSASAPGGAARLIAGSSPGRRRLVAMPAAGSPAGRATDAAHADAHAPVLGAGVGRQQLGGRRRRARSPGPAAPPGPVRDSLAPPVDEIPIDGPSWTGGPM